MLDIQAKRLNEKKAEEHHLHHVCCDSIGLGLNDLHSKTQAGVFSLYTVITVQTRTSQLLNFWYFTQNKNVRVKDIHVTCTKQSPTPSEGGKPSENVTKVRTAAHNI